MVNFLSLFSFAYAILIVQLSFTESYNGGGDGFSVELIHRDSPKSPFYYPSESNTKRLAKALRRSLSRVNHFKKRSPQSQIIPNNGEYLMNVSIGSPPFGLLAILDTGSDLMWIQCKPCRNCYKQDDPIFDPKSSKTYQRVSCKSKRCQSFDSTSCNGDDDTCRYVISYGDRSHSIGNVAIDTLTMGSKTGRAVSFPKFTFGCGHDNGGNSFNKRGTGIVGLGGSSVSLISQLGSSISGKFSYCLVPFSETESSSKLSFGWEAIVSGAKSVSTPLSRKISHKVFYYLTLEAISVGDKRLMVNESSSIGDSEGNIIIDSGTTLTLLPSSFYSKLESQVAKSVKAKPVEDPSGVLSLCYNSSSNFKAPTITTHFSGADLKLNDYNTFVQVSDGVVCLAFAANDDISIYGNIAQAGFLVGYDLGKKTVSFLPTDCSQS